MGKISEIFNFDNIGGKIKNLAKWSCWITILLTWIAAPIAFIVLVSDEWTAEFCWIPLVGAIIAPIFVWIGSWAMYAFGEFVEDVHAIRNKQGTTKEVNIKCEEKSKSKAEEKLKCEANGKNKCETEERLKRESIERNRREAIMRKEPLLTKPILPMDKPKGFQPDLDWETNISSLSNHEIYTRYIDEAEWSEEYRYHCYLELNKRGVQSVQIASQYNAEKQNELKILPNGKGYICPLCGFPNLNFLPCAQCGNSPFENTSENTDSIDDEYADVTCPKCGKLLSFLKSEVDGMCPECGTKFDIK